MRTIALEQGGTAEQILEVEKITARVKPVPSAKAGLILAILCGRMLRGRIGSAGENDGMDQTRNLHQSSCRIHISLLWSWRWPLWEVPSTTEGHKMQAHMLLSKGIWYMIKRRKSCAGYDRKSLE